VLILPRASDTIDCRSRGCIRGRERRQMTGAIPGAWTVALEGKPDFDEAMQRVSA